MTLTLELSLIQENILRKRAADAGLEPADYLLAAAGLKTEVNSELDTSTEVETNSAYDLFRGLTGGIRSGHGHLSENTGAAFAEGMEEKRRQGHL
ncbi:MAG: hypothetical protein JWN14_3183 [Chthonomonadales bacterium]|nr:hypothetical protein [Chthonomonadales bacterium]